MSANEAPPRHNHFRPSPAWYTPPAGFEPTGATKQTYLLLSLPVTVRTCERRRRLVGPGALADLVQETAILEDPLPAAAQIPIMEELRVDAVYTSCPFAVFVQGGKLVHGRIQNMYAPLPEDAEPRSLLSYLDLTRRDSHMTDEQAWAWFGKLPESDVATFASSPDARAALQAIVERIIAAKFAALGALGTGRFLSALARTSIVREWTPAAAPSGVAGFQEALTLQLDSTPPEQWPALVAEILK